MTLVERADAWAILTEFTQSDSLRKHAHAVEASMRAYAPDYSGIPRVALLDRALYACDELSGFAFARAVNRDDVYRGAAELGVDLDVHIAFVVQTLEGVAPEIGLARA